MTPGHYTITWGLVDGWIQPATETNLLVAGSGIEFHGEYEAEIGSIVIDSNPDAIQAPWLLSGLEIEDLSGSGDTTLTEQPIGDYTLEWGHVEGWLAPDVQSMSLGIGATLTFNATYFPVSPPLGDFTLIESGSFWMGAQGVEPGDELGSEADEYPQHRVTLTQSFEVQCTEVTNQAFIEMAQWAVERGFARVSGMDLFDALDDSTVKLLDLDDSDTEISYSDGEFICENPDHPMIKANWYCAVSYCDWISLRAGLDRAYSHTDWSCNDGDPYPAEGYRLPTEAEWEFACRSGSATAFATGEISHVYCLDPILDQVGWYCGNAGDWTHMPAGKNANAWGLHDMHGNVWEWCNDLYTADYYDQSPEFDPAGPPSGSMRVKRGGGWSSSAHECRSANRGGYAQGNSYITLGFRVVRSKH